MREEEANKEHIKLVVRFVMTSYIFIYSVDNVVGNQSLNSKNKKRGRARELVLKTNAHIYTR